LLEIFRGGDESKNYSPKEKTLLILPKKRGKSCQGRSITRSVLAEEYLLLHLFSRKKEKRIDAHYERKNFFIHLYFVVGVERKISLTEGKGADIFRREVMGGRRKGRETL